MKFGNALKLIFFGSLFFSSSAWSQKIVWENEDYISSWKGNFIQLQSGGLCAASSKGLLFFNGADWEKLDSELSGILSTTNVKTIFEDAQENIWVGYAHNSIQKITKEGEIIDFEAKNDRDNLLVKGSTNQFFPKGDTLLVATDYGLFYVNDQIKVLAHYAFSDDYPTVLNNDGSIDLMRVIIADEENPNRIFIGGTMGLTAFDLETHQWHHYPMPESIVSLALKPKYSFDKCNNLMVTGIVQRKNKLYSTSWGGGLLVLDLDTEEWAHYPFQAYGTETMLDENITVEIAELNDSLLICTTQAFKSPVIFNLNTDQYVDFELIFGEKSVNDYSTAIYKIEDYVLIGYSNSITAYLFNSSAHVDQIPTPILSGIKSTETVLYKRQFADSIPYTISLAAQQANLELNFGMNFKRDLTYEFQLVGIDKSPRYGQQAVYTDLPGGDYLFRYRLKGSDEERIISFVKIKKWHEQKGIVLGIGIGLLILMFLIFRIITQRKERKNQEKKEFDDKIKELERKALQSQMNPHFLFNSLNSIKSFVIQNDKNKAIYYINDFSKLIREILAFSNEEDITLRQEIDHLNLFILLEKQRFNDKFDFEIQEDENIDYTQTRVPPFILQPFVENAIWHGLMHKKEAGNLVLSIKKETNHLLIEIKDDGIGRTAAALLKSDLQIRKQSYGIELSKQRFSNYFGTNYSINIIDNSPSGTIVSIKLNI